jgi:hypothetical protein
MVMDPAMCSKPAILLLICVTLAVSSCSPPAKAGEVKILVAAEPTETARINRKLFGNFIELLEDVVPGTWSEMLLERTRTGRLSSPSAPAK